MRITTLMAALLTTATAACVEAPARAYEPLDAGSASTDAVAQECTGIQTVTGDKYISSNDDVADMVPNTCWMLSGNLTIRGNGVVDISKLGDLRSVNNLIVDETTNLTTLATHSPFQVGGSIQITNNAGLTNLDNVIVTNPSLVTIDSNAALTSIGGLANMESVQGDLQITNNAALTDITLRSLTTVANTALVQTITISNNTKLTSITAPELTAINRLIISGNPALTTVSSLGATVVGHIEITNNALLTDLGTMGSLTSITDSFTLDSNPALTTLGMFTTAMKTITNTLTITNNKLLTAPMGEPLSHLTHIGTVTITGNTALSTCVAKEIDQCVQTTTQSTINGNKNANNCNYWCN